MLNAKSKKMFCSRMRYSAIAKWHYFSRKYLSKSIVNSLYGAMGILTGGLWVYAPLNLYKDRGKESIIWVLSDLKHIIPAGLATIYYFEYVDRLWMRYICKWGIWFAGQFFVQILVRRDTQQLYCRDSQGNYLYLDIPYLRIQDIFIWSAHLGMLFGIFYAAISIVTNFSREILCDMIINTTIACLTAGGFWCVYLTNTSWEEDPNSQRASGCYYEPTLEIGGGFFMLIGMLSMLLAFRMSVLFIECHDLLYEELQGIIEIRLPNDCQCCFPNKYAIEQEKVRLTEQHIALPQLYAQWQLPREALQLTRDYLGGNARQQILLYRAYQVSNAKQACYDDLERGNPPVTLLGRAMM